MITAVLKGTGLTVEITASGFDVVIMQIAGERSDAVAEFIEELEQMLELRISAIAYLGDPYAIIETAITELGWSIVEIKQEPGEAPDDVVY